MQSYHIISYELNGAVYNETLQSNVKAGVLMDPAVALLTTTTTESEVEENLA